MSALAAIDALEAARGSRTSALWWAAADAVEDALAERDTLPPEPPPESPRRGLSDSELINVVATLLELDQDDARNGHHTEKLARAERDIRILRMSLIERGIEIPPQFTLSKESLLLLFEGYVVPKILASLRAML